MNPPTYFIITEVLLNKGCEHGRYFRMPLDPGGKEFSYRGRTAVNAFFFGLKNRNRKGKEVLYHIQEEGESKRSLEITQKHLPDWPTPVYINVDSIWEFFKIIGFNNKTKKYE